MNIIASTSKKPYTEFIADALNKAEPYNVKGIAVVILTDTENLTGYWNMDLSDKIRAKSELEYDTMDDFIMANIDRYGDAYINNEEEEQ